MQIINTTSTVENIFGYIACFFGVLIIADSMVKKWMAKEAWMARRRAASARRCDATQRDVEAQEEAQDGPDMMSQWMRRKSLEWKVLSTSQADTQNHAIEPENHGV